MTRCTSPGCQTTAGCVCGQVGRITFGPYTPAPANDGRGTAIVDITLLAAENARLRVRIEALEAALSSQQADRASVVEDEWQPIETAPHIGDVLVYCEDTDEQFVAYWTWDTGRGCDFWVYARPMSGRRSHVVVGCNPTHWRPLPPPPAIRALADQPASVKGDG